MRISEPKRVELDGRPRLVLPIRYVTPDELERMSRYPR